MTSSSEEFKKLSYVRTKPKNKFKQTSLGITGVNPIRTHGFGVYKGRRVVWGVRVDENLLKQAKPVLRAKFGSDCRGVETWLAGLVAVAKGEQLSGVNPSNTVEIGNLIIERNLRPRRKMVAEIEEVRKVTYKHEIVCGYCDDVATWEVEPNSSVADRRVYACDVHYSNLLNRRLVGDSKHLVAKEAP